MEIVFHVHFYISISIGFFQVLFKFYANFWGYSSFINGLNRELASQVSTERSLSLVYVILNVLSICQNILSHIRSEVFYAIFSSLFCFSSSNSRRTSSPYLSIIRTRKSIHGSLTVKYKKKCSQALWYLLFLRQLFCFVL